MSASKRGGAVVGQLDDLGPVEAGAVLFLRMWNDGPRSGARDGGRQHAFMSELCSGSQAVEAFDQICALCAKHGRRPLMRHAVGCNCVGADENCFAHMIGAAAEGTREDAMMMAALIVRPDFAPALAALSEQFGLAMKRMATAQSLAGQRAAVIH